MAKTQPKATKKRIAIVDDHPIVRQGLRALIDSQDDMTVCAEAGGALEALKVVKQSDPDLAVVDISLKDSSGIDLIKDLKVRHPALSVLVLSMHDESFYAERVLRAGAKGYITKVEASETVISAVRAILDGRIYLSEKMASKMLAKFVDGPTKPESTPIQRLTDRELQVFELMGHGLTTRETAERLCLSIKTVETHRANIKRKLKLDSSTELLRHAIQWVRVDHAG